MKTKIAWTNMAYQGSFSVPLFDWANQSPELQKCIYEMIGSTYNNALKVDDIYASAGSSMRYSGLGLSLFGGNASIDLTPKELKLEFRNMRRDSDLKIGQNCITLVIEAVRKVCPETVILNENLSVYIFMNPVDGDARSHLSKFAPANINIDLTEIGATEQSPSITLEIANSTEHWQANCNVGVLNDGSVFVFSRTHCDRDGDGTIDVFLDRLYRLFRTMLVKTELEVT